MTTPPDYVAVCPECGAHVALMSGRCEFADKEAAGWILAGLSVVRMDRKDVKLKPHDPNCPMVDNVESP